MDKKRGILREIFLIFLFVLLGIAIYLVYQMYLEVIAEPEEFKVDMEKERSFYSNSQFYPNMRFNHRRIGYVIQEGCKKEKIERVEEAMEKLSNPTPISFYPGKGEIIIECEEKEEEIEEEYFIAGEGGPVRIINTSQFYIIEEGKILLFYEESKCNNYNVELHELLHVFGFKHSENKNSIMYNTTSCYQGLTKDIIDDLNKLYSIKELPDFEFTNVKAEKIGGRLNFEVEVRNQGLIMGNAKLELWLDEKFKEFDLKDIDYGEGKIFEAKNVKLPSRNIESITFKLEGGEELNSNNNIANLRLK
jgi:hypothetical protein